MAYPQGAAGGAQRPAGLRGTPGAVENGRGRAVLGAGDGGSVSVRLPQGRETVAIVRRENVVGLPQGRLLRSHELFRRRGRFRDRRRLARVSLRLKPLDLLAGRRAGFVVDGLLGRGAVDRDPRQMDQAGAAVPFPAFPALQNAASERLRPLQLGGDHRRNAGRERPNLVAFGPKRARPASAQRLEMQVAFLQAAFGLRVLLGRSPRLVTG